jgi:hypothetical protein
MFEVPLGCPKFGLYADYKVNTIPYGSPEHSSCKKVYGFKIQGLVLGPNKLLSYPVQ